MAQDIKGIRSRSARAAAAVLLALGACTAGDRSDAPTGNSNDRQVMVVRVLPESTSVVVGANLFFSADVRDDRGQQVVNVGVAWSSSDTTIATVDTMGAVRVRGTGNAEIRAVSHGKGGVSRLLSSPIPVAAVSVTPSISTIQSGTGATLIARVLSASDSVLLGRAVTWGSSDPAIASVDAAGNVSANAIGSAVIRATSEGTLGLATVNVVAPPPPPPPSAVTDVSISAVTDTTFTIRFTEVTDGLGAPANYLVRFAPPPLTWATANNVSRGTCTGTIAGTATGAVRTCTIRGLVASTSYRVQAIAFRGSIGQGEVYGPLSNVASGTTAGAPVASVSITPAAPSVVAGASTALTAVARDAAGNVLTGRPVSWSSTAPTVASVASNGVVSGLVVGTASIRATVEGVTGSATVAVTAPPPTLVSLTLTPPSISIFTGGFQQFSVTGQLSNGASTSVAVNWTATGGSINATGFYTAASVAGTYRVIATQTGGSIADTSVVVLTTPPPVTPWVVEDFSSYASTADLLANPRGTFRTSEDQRTGDISLDMTQGVGASGRSMKFTFPSQATNSATRCTIDYSISRWVKFPQPVKEVWAEIWVKFSSNFTTRVPTDWGCAGNADYKFVVLAQEPAIGRWQIKMGTYGTHWSPNHAGGSGDTYVTTNSGNGGLWNDDQWHRLRWHARVSTTTTSNDGAFEWWLDNVKQSYPLNISTSTNGLPVTSLTDLRLGANLNLGPAQVQTINWGAVRLYNQNPGW
ncbi:MAG: Ig-like domain-containing protein [Gemmatimonadaceae bacterium]|nr:Ig-like domain-containing protein [Gemmatimonadaceae bacterium]